MCIRDSYEYRFCGAELFVIHAGCGELAAAAATQLLIICYKVDLVVNFGVVGGLTPQMALLKCCVVRSVVHYDICLLYISKGLVYSYFLKF